MSGDLPLGIATALVLLTVALVFLVVNKPPALPESLPPLSYDPHAVERAHSARTEALPPAWREAMAAWEALVNAQAELAKYRAEHSAPRGNVERPLRERELMSDSEHALGRFTEIVQLATGRGLAGPMAALRSEARKRFLRDLSRNDARWGAITARHGLSGDGATVFATRAVRIAWFDYRWERFATPTPEQGDVGALGATLGRIPYAERRALVSWGLSARCGELLGVSRYPSLGEPTRCAQFRRDLIDEAMRLDRAYPESEARAAMDVLQAEGLRALATRTEDVHDLAVMNAEAEHALLQAQGRYALLMESHRSRRIERYYKGVVTLLNQ